MSRKSYLGERADDIQVPIIPADRAMSTITPTQMLGVDGPFEWFLSVPGVVVD